MKGFVQTLCEIGADDSKCTSETVRYFEQYGSLSYGATALYSSSGTKAVFREVDYATYESTGTVAYFDGKMVSDDAHTKMTYRGSEVCEKLDNRGYLPINIRSSSLVNRFESSHRGVAVESTNSPRVPLNSFSSPSPLDARVLAVCRLFSRTFRSSRSFVPSASPSVVFPVPRVVLPPLPPPRFPPRLASFSSPGRARCRDIAMFIRSFGWTRCSVLRVMTRECTRAQTTTSYDSRYMECTSGYIRWRSSRRLESRRRRRTDDARDRGRDDETFPSPGDGDDRTTSPSVRVIQPSSRVCLDSFFVSRPRQPNE